MIFTQKPQIKQPIGTSHSRSHERTGPHLRRSRKSHRSQQARRRFDHVRHKRQLEQNHQDEGFQQKLGHQIRRQAEERLEARRQPEQDQERIGHREDSPASDDIERGGRQTQE